MRVPFNYVSYIYKARSLARLYDVPFDLEVSDIEKVIADTPHCPVTGLMLYNTAGLGGGPNSPNLVRLVPHRGFVRGNLVALSRRARTMRHDATPAELRRLADLIEAGLHSFTL